MKSGPRSLRQMGASDVVEQVRTVAGRVAASYGLEIFDVSFRREGPGMVLRVQIDRPGPAASAEESVSVADCASVSRDLSAILDVDDVVPVAYTLEVSSPGLERGLYKRADFERFAGSQAKLKTRQPIDGQRNFRGRLLGVDGDDVLFDDRTNGQVRVPLDLITKANLEVDVSDELRGAR